MRSQRRTRPEEDLRSDVLAADLSRETFDRARAELTAQGLIDRYQQAARHVTGGASRSPITHHQRPPPALVGERVPVEVERQRGTTLAHFKAGHVGPLPA